MINIHKQLWVAKGVGRSVDNSKYLLSYMTHTEYSKSKEETKAFLKRKETGKQWAEGRFRKTTEQSEELTFDNTPVEGFRIVNSVSRWSTSNKLIQVEDPRGFVVEIPTGNLTTLLRYVIIKEATIKGKCVWGRSEGQHILLPVNSEIYVEACKQVELNSEKVSFSKLSKGQVIRFSVDDKSEYIYLGRGKAKWLLETKQATEESYNRWTRARYPRLSRDSVIKEDNLIDKKYCFIFRSKNKSNGKYYWEYKIAGKAIVAGVVGFIPSIEPFDISLPERMYKGYDRWGTDSTGKYLEVTSSGVVIKVDKL